MSESAHSHNGNTTRIRREPWLRDFHTIRRADLDRALLEIEELEPETVQAIRESDWTLKLVFTGTNGRLWVGVDYDGPGPGPDAVPPPDGELFSPQGGEP